MHFRFETAPCPICGWRADICFETRHECAQNSRWSLERPSKDACTGSFGVHNAISGSPAAFSGHLCRGCASALVERSQKTANPVKKRGRVLFEFLIHPQGVIPQDDTPSFDGGYDHTRLHKLVCPATSYTQPKMRTPPSLPVAP